MTTIAVDKPTEAGSRPSRRPAPLDERGKWWRFVLILVITGIAIVPIGAVVLLSLRPGLGSAATGPTLENFGQVFAQTNIDYWLENSLGVTIIAVILSLAVAAPAGYVISRVRNRLVSGYSLLLFIVQSLPIVTAVIPLFMLFSRLGLVDNLAGVTIIYIGAHLSVAVWMMAAYYDSIPISLEEAAWMDGCSVFGGFVRIVLRNALPGILSTAIFCFLVSWNDYLISVVFLRSDVNYTLPVGLQTFFQQNSTNWGLVMAVAVIMMLPPVIIFAVLNRYFSVGGIGGSLAGR